MAERINLTVKDKTHDGRTNFSESENSSVAKS